MAKQGMKRPEITRVHPKNEQAPVSELQGKVKHTKTKAGPVTKGTKPKDHKKEKPISSAYSTIDTDVARDNLENDLSAADLQDL